MTDETKKQDVTEQRALTLREKRLSTFAPSRAEVRELATRFTFTLSYRGSDKLSDQERLALANFCLATELIPGREAWAIPNQGIMVGHAGWVKKLNEAGDAQGFKWWAEYERPRADELEAEGIDPAKVHFAARCTIRRSDLINTHADLLIKLTGAGLTWDNGLKEMLGRPPVTEGIGVIWAAEVDDLTRGKSHMSLKERAEKRAFDAAARKMIHIPLAQWNEGDRTNGDVMDTDYLVSGPDPEPAPEPAPEAIEGEIVPQATGPEPEIKRPLAPDDLKKWITTLAVNGKQVEANSNFQGFIRGKLDTLFSDDKPLRHDFLKWQFGIESSSDLNHAQCLALRRWMMGDGDDITEAAQQEAARVITHLKKDGGQMDMFGDMKRAISDLDLASLKARVPANWKEAAERINAVFETKWTAGSLSQAVREHEGLSFGDDAEVSLLWPAAVEIAQGKK